MTIGRRAAANSTRIGVAGAVIVFVGIALLFAFEQPPFVAPDETAHVGYAHEIAGFELPEVTKSPDVPDSAVQWQAERESSHDDRYRAVWVANHPPLHYMITAPLIWLSNALDRPDGGLMFMRLANIAFAAIGVVLTYFLGRDLSGGIRRIGVAGAAIAALVPQGHTLFSEAMNDGIGFAAATAVVWAAVRCIGTSEGRYGRGDLVLLGAAAAACAGARSATLVVAVVVVIWVAVTRLLTAPGSTGARLAAAVYVAAIGLLPAALLFGWYYIRNDRLYGDFAGSEFLLDRFRRIPKGSLLEVLSWGHLWVDLYHMLLSPSPVFTWRHRPVSIRRWCSPPSASSSWRSPAAPVTSSGAASTASSPALPSPSASSSSSSSSSRSPSTSPVAAAATPAICCLHSASPQPCSPSGWIGCGRGCCRR